MSPVQNRIFTVGHSTHTIEAFVELLRRHGVTAVADVRSAPFSRFNPQFNKDALEHSLKPQGLKYVFLGHELGARPDDPTCYLQGRVQYARLARTELFRSGLERLLRGLQDHRIALMCAEKEPLECHRTLLVANAIERLGVAVEHILADGRLEPHGDAMVRLLDIVRLPHEDLFRSQRDLIAEAIARQAEKVAYVDASLTAEPEGDTGDAR